MGATNRIPEITLSLGSDWNLRAPDGSRPIPVSRQLPDLGFFDADPRPPVDPEIEWHYLTCGDPIVQR